MLVYEINNTDGELEYFVLSVLTVLKLTRNCLAQTYGNHINPCVLNVLSYLNVSTMITVASYPPRLGNVARTIAPFSRTNPG